MKAVILARISSKEQSEGHSLDAQTRNLKQYADGKNLTVIKEYTLVESSTKQQRPEFDAMISFIKRQDVKIALVVDTVDRLQRSFRETPIFNELMQQDIIELHFVKEGNVLCKNATSTQKLMWNMGVVMAQSYTDQLSDNVRRSMKHKVRNGEWCGLAPIGYLNVIDNETGKASVEPNEENAEIIKRIFIKYASGKYSLSEITRLAKSWGFKSNKGNDVCNQIIHTMIQNPFYYGFMKVKGEMHPHKYEPLISKDLFDRCQIVRTKRAKNIKASTNKKQFLFSGLIKCAVSDRIVTCDLKKGKYVYLICRDPDNHKKKMWVKEQDVIDQIETALQPIMIPDDQIDDVIAYIKKSSASEQSDYRDNQRHYRKQLLDVETQIDRLTDLLINNHITKEAHQRKHTQLQLHHNDLTARLTRQQVTFKDTERALITLVKFMNRITVTIKSSKNDEIRVMLKTLFSNFFLNGRNLRWVWVSGMFEGRKSRSLHEWLGFCDDVRTYHHEDLLLLTQDLPSELFCDDQSP